VRWQLGGRHSSFKLAAGTHFHWQHDARFHAGGLISVFDNGADPPEAKQSRALLLRADTRTHTASVVKQFVNPSSTLLAPSQGNALELPGGNWLVGYGGLPSFTEFGPSGRVLLDASLGKDVQDFTTSLARWSGRPSGAPALAARPLGGSALMLAASWNGATHVASWRVLRGETPYSLRPLLSRPKRGFETTIEVPLRGRYVAVQALDRAGAVLGTSATLSG